MYRMCDTDLRRCCCGAGFPEHRLVWSQGCTLSLSQVRHSNGLQRGWVTIMTHAQMCVADLRRCFCSAGFQEHCLVWSQARSSEGVGHNHDTCTDVCQRSQEMLLQCRIRITLLSLVTRLHFVNLTFLRGGVSIL